MRLSEFDYHLPEELIAQEPLADRGGSRMMLVDRALGKISDHAFADLPEFLAPGDVLAVYSDGITEAENSEGKPFDERGLEGALPNNPTASVLDLAKGVFRAVEGHAGDVRLADDLTILLLRRSTAAAV